MYNSSQSLSQDGAQLSPGRGVEILEEGSLELDNPTARDSGVYECVAENVANRRLSPPARLNVHGKTFSEKKGHLIRAKQPFAAKKKIRLFLNEKK